MASLSFTVTHCSGEKSCLRAQFDFEKSKIESRCITSYISVNSTLSCMNAYTRRAKTFLYECLHKTGKHFLVWMPTQDRQTLSCMNAYTRRANTFLYECLHKMGKHFLVWMPTQDGQTISCMNPYTRQTNHFLSACQHKTDKPFLVWMPTQDGQTLSCTKRWHNASWRTIPSGRPTGQPVLSFSA